ncbi:MAG: alanine--tRNA ligase [Acidobacteria bacterium]|nr:alanine--tRNA ligase [Acidobacteriota bacterium]
MSVYEELTDSQQFACRVIADHARSTTFAIADGILPGNEGRNYVLRKIMRRAIYHGREHLGLKDAFFYKVCDKVVDEMQDAYPEIGVQRDFIGKMVRLEEERFGNTVTVGLGKLNELGINAGSAADPELFVNIAKLYDTYGTPRDLIRVFLEENGIVFEEEDFNERFDAALQELQQQSGVGQTQRKTTLSPVYSELAESVGKLNFHGYDTTFLEDAEVVAIIRDDARVNELKQGEEGLIVLRDTPFYAESGGQVGDTGSLFSSDARVKVLDTFAPVAGVNLHKSKVEQGTVKAGDKVTASVDAVKRDATRRNHTATHLVHAALREVLGTHVKQAGSVVAPGYLRFDYTHYQPLTETEINEIEDLVNRYILENNPVNTNIMSIEEAMKSGAMALFGEKYGSDVRVLSVGDGQFSKELCGGTHVRATGDIGSFKITADEAIASGVRRIRAITGFDSFHRFREDEDLIARSLNALKTQRDNLPNAIERLQEDLKRTRKEVDELKMKLATGGGAGGQESDDVQEIKGVKVVAKLVDGLDKGGMRHLSDTLLARLKSGVVILGRTEDDKVSFIVRVSDDLTDKVKAGNIIKEMAQIVGGRGGGRPDMAEGGGSDTAKADEAITAGLKMIETAVGE